MPKISNWEKMEEGRWMNEKTNDEAHVIEDTTRGQFGEETHYYPALNGEIIRGDWAETSRREALDRLRRWMKQNPYAGQEQGEPPFTDEDRQKLIRTIVGVRSEENDNRSSDDRLTPEELDHFRETLVERDDGELKDIWYQWVGRWLEHRPEYSDEVDLQFKKTLRGEHDYGFV